MFDRKLGCLAILVVNDAFYEAISVPQLNCFRIQKNLTALSLNGSPILRTVSRSK